MSDIEYQSTTKKKRLGNFLQQVWMGNNLRRQLTVSFLLVAVIPLIITAAIVSYRSFSTQAPLALETQSQIAKRVAEQVRSFILERELELRTLIEAGDLENLNRNDQTSVLKNLISTQEVYDELILLNANGQEIVYVSRLEVVTPDTFGSRKGKDEFERPTATGQTYYSPVSFNDVNGQPFQIISIPIYNLDSGRLKYVLIANFRFKTVWDLMAEADVVGSGIVYLVDNLNQVIAHANPSIALQKRVVKLPAQDSFTTGLDGETVAMALEPIALNEQVFTVVAEQPSSEALALPTNNAIISVVITLGIALLAGLIGISITGLITNPIGRLSDAAQAISQGDFSRSVLIDRQDEIGNLANAFNSMSVQLQSTLQGLEQRVADRTRNLALAAEVGRSVSQVRDLDVMLKDACELILKEFNLYYVQVYLADPSGSTLKLEAGTGSVGSELIGRRHSLPLNTGSINGRAAVEKRSVVISDTTQSATFRQNPLLPDTRGEMAVPLIVSDKVVGVLDMQSSEPGVLTGEILPAFEALAGQLAVAIQNANLLIEAEQARVQVEAQARRLVREGWNEHLDAIHKPEQLGFVYENNKVTPLVADDTQLSKDGKAVSASIAVTGEPLGSLVVEIDDETRHEQTSELVNAVARQVAQQIENLRLLESAERYRSEAEEAARRATVEGWKKYIDSRSENIIGYMYDSNEVKALDKEPELSSVTLPIKVGNETIGNLSIPDAASMDDQSAEIAKAVVERLGVHIDNLRLFEETKRGQIELNKRALDLAAVSEISTASTRELDIQKLLETVVNLTKERFNLYHAHVYLLNETADTLKLAAGAGDVGKQMVAEGWQIPVDHQDSIVARATRTRQSVISNDIVHEKDSEFLSNRLLPDTRSEMAVPLMVGDKVLGVFDVQSDVVNAFSQEDASIQTTLASQIATALQNARTFSQAQSQAQREAMLNTINQKIQSATSVEAVLQIAARELGRALGAPLTIAQLGMGAKESVSPDGDGKN